MLKVLAICVFLCSEIPAKSEPVDFYSFAPTTKNFVRSRYSERNRIRTNTLTTTALPDSQEIYSTTPAATTTETDEYTTSEWNEYSSTTDENPYTTTPISLSRSSRKMLSRCGEQIGDDFPWIAVLEHTDSTGRSRRRTFSKGVLISPRYVLTTISSMHSSPPFWVVSKVRLGDYPTWGVITASHNRSSVISIDVESVYLHQNKDIAVIKLAREANAVGIINPICLPENNEYNYHDLQLHVCKRSNGRVNVELKPAFPLTSQDCSIMFERKGAHFTPDKFCAWDNSGDSCTGDLGSPLLRKINGRYYVIGLNSFVSSKEIFQADDYPGVYTNVGAHINWISNILDQNY